MKNYKRILSTVALFLVCIFCFPTTVYAYMDPGSGSMLLQMLGVAFIAAGGVFVLLKARITAFFRRKKGGTADVPSDETDLTEEENLQ